jgi:hypothetical protein
MSTKLFRRTVACAALLWGAGAAPLATGVNRGDFPLPDGCALAARELGSAGAGVALKSVYPPSALQVRTLSSPTVFASAGRNYLIYELDLQNYSAAPMSVIGVDVMDASAATEKRIATFDATELNALLRPTGVDYLQYHDHPHVDANRELGAGRSAVAFLCLAFDGKSAVPGRLRHRVHLENESSDGPVLTVQRHAQPAFGPPLLGPDWHPRNGPQLDTHHRMGLMVADGLAQNSRRFAIDWRKSRNGAFHSGDARDVHAYYAYGETILAVADGTVVEATDMYPDNIPRSAAGFETAVPITLDNLGGNMIVIALGDGRFAQYFHLRPGSVRVKRGERVHRGQWIGQVGNSGDARNPHLHFQLVNTPKLFAGEGLPFVVDHFSMKLPGQEWSRRANEFPWGDETEIDFGPAARMSRRWPGGPAGPLGVAWPRTVLTTKCRGRAAERANRRYSDHFHIHSDARPRTMALRQSKGPPCCSYCYCRCSCWSPSAACWRKRVG